MDEPGPFQPRDGRAHFGVGVAVFEGDAGFDVFVAEDFSGSDYDPVPASAPGLAQAAKNLGDVPPAQLGERADAKLPLAILLVIEQHALGGPPVPSGAPGLLEVILQRAGRVGMDDQPHVLFVDAHAEGVGGADDLDVASQEFVLDSLLFGRRQAGVKMSRLPAFVLEKFGGLPGGVASGAKNDRAAGAAAREPIGEQVVHAFQLGVRGDGLDFEPEIVPLDAPFEKRELPAGLVLEIFEDLLFDISLGGGGEAGNRRDISALGPGKFADEPPGIEVIRAEIVPPFGEAVGFVENPAAYFALGDGLAKGTVAKLFRGDIQQRHVPEPDPAQHVAPLRRRQQAVKRRGEGCASAANQSVNLILHQRLQRRDDQREDAPTIVSHQGRQLVAE